MEEVKRTSDLTLVLQHSVCAQPEQRVLTGLDAAVVDVTVLWLFPFCFR